MNIFKKSAAFSLLLIAAIGFTQAAIADYHHGHKNYYKQQQKAYKKSMKHARKYYSWNEERGMYRNNWNRASSYQRRQYDSQLAAQWRAYHHNNWRGQPNWNNYNDPAFLDYLHTSNPGLLTNLRTILNF